jgi:hypothetical protein
VVAPPAVGTTLHASAKRCLAVRVGRG